MKTLKEQNIFSVSFFPLRTRPLANGDLPIYVQLYYATKRTQFSFQCSIPEKEWDFKKGMVKSSSPLASQINKDIIDIKERFFKIYNKLVELRITFTVQHIKMRFFDDNEEEAKAKDMGLLCYFDLYMAKIKKLVNVELTPSTIKKYQTTYNHLQDFLHEKQKCSDISMQLLGPSFMRSLQDYISIDKKCNHNTSVKYLKNIKKLTTMAFEEGLIELNPFRGIRFKYEEVDADYLDVDELEVLRNKEFSNDRIQLVKDTFVLCCYTGLAYVDIFELCKSDISEHKGQKFINKRRRKTNQMSTIPLFKPALEIIEKYSTHPVVLKGNCVIPVISNQKMNNYLKEIADLCGISKSLTTHMARHTFATSVTLANGISKDVVAKMLGHSSTRMTDKYARVTNDLIFNSTRELAEMLEKN